MKRAVCFLLSIAIVIVFASASFAQSRVTRNFDADWLFAKGEIAGAEKSEFPDKDWRKLDVPHDWSIEGPFDEKNPTGGGGGYLPSGIAWYRKHFSFPAAKTTAACLSNLTA